MRSSPTMTLTSNALRLLTDADLVSLGVSLGHRRVLLKAIAELNASASPSPPHRPGKIP